MLANLLVWFGLHLVIEQCFHQTLCVSYFTYWILTSEHSSHYMLAIYVISFLFIFYLTIFLCRHYALANLLSLFEANLVINWWLKQTFCVSYFTEWNHNFFIIAIIYIINDVAYIYFWFFCIINNWSSIWYHLMSRLY